VCVCVCVGLVVRASEFEPSFVVVFVDLCVGARTKEAVCVRTKGPVCVARLVRALEFEPSLVGAVLCVLTS